MRRRLVLAAGVVLVAIGVGAGSAPSFGAGASNHTASASSTSDDMRSGLRDLAGAWADGGGRFGYPYWSKAGQRWRMGEITASMFREYVTGYRDRLVLGCDLLGHVDVHEQVSEAVRNLVLDACTSRVDALREQQRSLDDAIRSAAGGPSVDTDQLVQSSSEHSDKATERFQESFRDTRLAMNRAQAALEQAGMDPLHEDAFL